MKPDITVECPDCGAENDPRDERPEDHDSDCQTREAMIANGCWEEWEEDDE